MSFSRSLSSLNPRIAALSVFCTLVAALGLPGMTSAAYVLQEGQYDCMRNANDKRKLSMRSSLERSLLPQFYSPVSTAPAAIQGSTKIISPVKKQRSRASKTQQKPVVDVGLVLRQAGVGEIYIGAIVPGAAADHAGLKPGDFIRKIDGLATNRYSDKTLLPLLNGPEGTSVKLEIARQTDGGILTIILVRKPPVAAKEFTLTTGSNYAYLKILTMGESLAQDLPAELKSVDWKKTRGVIVDLRGNPSGSLKGLDALFSQFLPQGTTYATLEYANARRVGVATSGNALVPPKSTVVLLLNEGVASNIWLYSFGMQRLRNATVLVAKGSRGKNDVDAQFDYGGTSQEPIMGVCAHKPGILLASTHDDWIDVPSMPGVADSTLEKAKQLIR